MCSLSLLLGTPECGCRHLWPEGLVSVRHVPLGVESEAHQRRRHWRCSPLICAVVCGRVEAPHDAVDVCQKRIRRDHCGTRILCYLVCVVVAATVGLAGYRVRSSWLELRTMREDFRDPAFGNQQSREGGRRLGASGTAQAMRAGSQPLVGPPG